jgi:hypothetical protein
MASGAIFSKATVFSKAWYGKRGGGALKIMVWTEGRGCSQCTGYEPKKCLQAQSGFAECTLLGSTSSSATARNAIGWSRDVGRVSTS